LKQPPKWYLSINKISYIMPQVNFSENSIFA
jgi:hypothetical protein